MKLTQRFMSLWGMSDERGAMSSPPFMLLFKQVLKCNLGVFVALLGRLGVPVDGFLDVLCDNLALLVCGG